MNVTFQKPYWYKAFCSQMAHLTSATMRSAKTMHFAGKSDIPASGAQPLCAGQEFFLPRF